MSEQPTSIDPRVVPQPAPVETPTVRSPAEDGAQLITKERARQILEEGRSPKHDDRHKWPQLPLMAIVYAMPPGPREHRDRPGLKNFQETYWPFESRYFKPTPDDRIRELVKAGALIAAEIDRLQRAGLRTNDVAAEGARGAAPASQSTQPPPQPAAEELLPCPFCGSEPQVLRSDELGWTPMAKCVQCCIEWKTFEVWNRRATLRPSPVDAGEADTDPMRIALIEANRDKAHLERALGIAQATLRAAYQYHLGKLSEQDQRRLGRDLAENWTKTNESAPVATAGVSDGERVKALIESLEEVCEVLAVKLATDGPTSGPKEDYANQHPALERARDALAAMTANQPGNQAEG